MPLRAHRKAASVFPDPVGARISVLSPRAIGGQPSCCARVGSAKARVNQSRTRGWNGARAGLCPAGGAERVTDRWYPRPRPASPGADPPPGSMSFRSSSLREHPARDPPRGREHRRPLGPSHPIRRGRYLARAGGPRPRRRRDGGGRGALGAVRVGHVEQRGRPGHRRQGRAHRGGARARAGPDQPRPPGTEGPPRLAGDGVARPPHRAAGAPGRGAGARHVGRGDGADRGPVRASCCPARAAGAGSASTPAASSSWRSTTRSP